jgi:hypothetical protein
MGLSSIFAGIIDAAKTHGGQEEGVCYRFCRSESSLGEMSIFVERDEAIKAGTTEPGTRLCVRNVRLSKGHCWFRDTATMRGEQRLGMQRWTACQRPAFTSYSCSSGLSYGATTHQLSSTGVPENVPCLSSFCVDHVWPGLIRRIGQNFSLKSRVGKTRVYRAS